MAEVLPRISPEVFAKSYTSCNSEDTLAALLRSHKLGLPLLVSFPSSCNDDDVECFAEVKPVFHCRRCSNFWNETHRTLTICYENLSYVKEPVASVTLSDAVSLICFLACGKVFATLNLTQIFPLLKQAWDEKERRKFLRLYSADGNRDKPKAFLACIGGELGPNNEIYPLGYRDLNGTFYEGGPSLKHVMKPMDASLYCVKAGEKSPVSSNNLNKQQTLDNVTPSTRRMNVTPSISQHGDAVEAINNLPTKKTTSARVQKESKRSKTSTSNCELKERKNVFERITKSNQIWTSSSCNEWVLDNPRRIYNTQSAERPSSPALAFVRYDSCLKKTPFSGLTTSQLCSTSAVNRTVWSKNGKPILTNVPMSRVAHAQTKARTSGVTLQRSDGTELRKFGQRDKNMSYLGSLICPSMQSEVSSVGSRVQYYNGAEFKKKPLHQFRDEKRRKFLDNSEEFLYRRSSSNLSMSAHGDYENDPRFDNGAGGIKRYNSMELNDLTTNLTGKGTYKMFDPDGNEVEISGQTGDDRDPQLCNSDTSLNGLIESNRFAASKKWQKQVKEEYAAHERTTLAHLDKSSELNADIDSKQNKNNSSEGAAATDSGNNKSLSKQQRSESMTKQQGSKSFLKRRSIGGRRFSKHGKAKKKHHRKHSQHDGSHFNIISSLNFTPSYHFSYFDMPAHVKEHNKDMSSGAVTISLQDFARKEPPPDVESHWSSFMDLSNLSLADSQS